MSPQEYLRLRPLILSPLLLLAAPTFAEGASASSAQDDDRPPLQSEIVVVATRIRGQVNVPQPPIMTLDEADIASYGATTIAELVDAVSPQTGSGRGRGGGHPVMLVNGQRISSFRELRAIPPEAIRRMEVLPEEVALRFGYPPDQRVINFILKDGFSSKTLAGEYNLPTHGGFVNSELEGGLLRIDGPSRLNIEAKIVDDTMLTEAERRLRQPEENTPTVATDPDPAAYRSLVSDSRELTLNGTWSTGLGKEGQSRNLSINAAYTRSDSRALLGLDTVLLVAPDGATARRSLPGPLERKTGADVFEAGIALNKALGAWLLTATVDASHSDTETRVDQPADISPLEDAAAAGSLPVDGPLPALSPAGSDRARTKDDALTSLVTLAGTPFRLPAGDASLTVKGGFAYSSTDNRDTRTLEPTKLKRGDLSAGANLLLPVASRKAGVLSGVGDLSLNLGGGLNHLSDFGTLADWNAGVTWSPAGNLTLQASYIVNEEAPSLNRLGNPELLTFDVPVYDFTRSETALVTIINGGNPDLKRETQRDLKLSANWELPFLKRANLIVEYFRNRSSDVTQDFPLLTPTIEAAFPDRAVRDAGGRLVSIDRRPVTFDKVESSRLRWGLNLSGRIGKGQERSGGQEKRPGFMRHGNGQGRWNLSAYHTYRLSERATISSDAGPVLDLLDGDALVTGGIPRHAVELEGGLFHKGFGLRLKGEWEEPVHVRSSGAPQSSDLRFGSTFVVDLRLFVNLGMHERLVSKAPIFKGMRLAFQFDNILDSRQKVTDGSGAVPLTYQADYRDPRGRIIGIDLRKMF